MPIFTASLGSVSRTQIAFLSRVFAFDSSCNHHQVLNFPQLSNCNSFKRAALLTPKVTVSSGSAAKTDDGVVQTQQQSSSLDDARQARRSADWKAAQAYKEKGIIYEGRVEGFNGGGLLVRFYSIVGFLPFPQLGPTYTCKEPQKSIQEIAKDLVGSVIPTKIIQADEENRRLIFSEKEALWSKFSQQIKVGDIFQGRVGSVEDYGAFIHLRFLDGQYYLTGLVHVSEVSWDLVQDARDILEAGDEVRVKIISVDRERSRVTLSIKQLEEDPLFETLETVIPQDASISQNDEDNSYDIEPLPGLEMIVQELLREDGINDVKISRQGFERRVVSQDLQLWLSNVPPVGNQFTLLARAGRQVQEILLTTSLDQEGIKRALQRVLERVP
ncbi:OLC1v1018873C1 [Oldenlandia corymbosa var. corymbosa]|uniref:OLC1v1018873C1 n=1 Tax=Oldenlandia corymbosa var. corymbosa TaxID=529605 RepID=A0AAV1ECT8_OLDCO|nr:OLC1v1018873C1 [Oldenlandia corymbosa var. corymbosa]